MKGGRESLCKVKRESEGENEKTLRNKTIKEEELSVYERTNV